MKMVRTWCSIAIFGLLALAVHVNGFEVDSFPILMPGVRPLKPETYFCTPVRVDPTQEYYIVGFSPNSTQEIAHHMLLYGCSAPGSMDEVWNCGEMATGRQPGLKTASPCAKGSQVVYAWARDAPRLDLPEGVGFKVGGLGPIQYLVLQVHYADVSPFVENVEKADESGITLHYTETPQPKAAGVFLLGTNGFIPPKSTEYMESACKISERVIMHPFAFRTHTHELGRVVAGYRVRREANGKDKWTLIGKMNPMRPQMFYPVKDSNMVIQQGDVLAARCTMLSDRNRTTKIGATNEDEMCNFYIMYWMDGVESLKQKYCFTLGPPFYYWVRGPPNLNNIPDKDASSI